MTPDTPQTEPIRPCLGRLPLRAPFEAVGAAFAAGAVSAVAGSTGGLGKAVVEGAFLDDLDRFLEADHAAAGGHPAAAPGRQAAPEQSE